MSDRVCGFSVWREGVQIDVEFQDDRSVWVGRVGTSYFDREHIYRRGWLNHPRYWFKSQETRIRMAIQHVTPPIVEGESYGDIKVTAQVIRNAIEGQR